MTEKKLHFGIISSPVPGHLNPLCAIGRELIRRGHLVTVMSILDTEDKITKEGLRFASIGEKEFPKGCWEKHWIPLAQRSGISVLLGTVKLHTTISEMMCRDVPLTMKRLGINAMVIDQLQFQGRAIADHMKVPFVNVSCTLVLNRDTNYLAPPPFVPWGFAGNNPLIKGMNFIAWKVFDRLAGPVVKAGDNACLEWGMKPYLNAENTYSPLAQIVPMPKNFDFPSRFIQKNIHYVGSFVDETRPNVPFPWQKLRPGKPLIYASFGTLQNHKTEMFETVASACKDIDADLVIAFGDWRSSRPIPQFEGNPIVVNYAPQLELLKKCSLCITHAGPNTVYESLTFGVPMVGFPIANDQPAVGARMKHSKIAEVMPLSQMSISNVKNAILKVLNDPSYREHALKFKDEIKNEGGVKKAGEIIERVCAKFYEDIS